MITRLSILLTFLFLFASCEKEQSETLTSAPSQTTVSFTYKSYHNTQSRAGAVSPTEAEKAVYDMDVFVCSDERFIGQLKVETDYTTTDTDDATTLQLTSAFLDAFNGQTLTFYFVANNTRSTGGKHIDGATFTGTATDFRNAATARLADSPWHTDGSKAELVCTYNDFNSATQGLLMTACVEVTLTGKCAETIELKYRSARFDVQNMGAAKYRVQYFYIYGAREQAALFSVASTDPSAFGTRDLERIIGPTAGKYTDTDDKGAQTIAPGIFYLYPTDLNTTKILAEVKDLNSGTTVTFEINTDALTDKTISANKRYIIYFSETGLGSIGDWENG